MLPSQPDPDWFKKYWYSQESAKPVWRVPAALVTMAVIMIAAWIA
jgi:hypothetical protein